MMRLEAWNNKAFLVLSYLPKTFMYFGYLAFKHNRYRVGNIEVLKQTEVSFTVLRVGLSMRTWGVKATGTACGVFGSSPQKSGATFRAFGGVNVKP